MPTIENMSVRQTIEERINWLNKGKEFQITSAGYKTKSMFPYLNGGEIVLGRINKSLKYSNLKYKLVIIGRWDKPDGVLHQVIDETPTHVLTKGINNMFSDGWKEREYIKLVAERVLKGI